MLKFLIQSNNENSIDMEFKTVELELLFNMVESHYKNCPADKVEFYEDLYRKVKALYLLNRQPDVQSLEQIKRILFPTNEVSSENSHNIKISNLSFTKRTFNCLNRAGIKTLGELLCLSQEDLLRIRNLGTQSLNEIIDFLKLHNLELSNYENT